MHQRPDRDAQLHRVAKADKAETAAVQVAALLCALDLSDRLARPDLWRSSIPFDMPCTAKGLLLKRRVGHTVAGQAAQGGDDDSAAATVDLELYGVFELLAVSPAKDERVPARQHVPRAQLVDRRQRQSSQIEADDGALPRRERYPLVPD